MDTRPHRPTLEDLEAMRQEYGNARHPRLVGSLAFDLRMARKLVDRGVRPERFARARGVPVEYMRALRRYLALEDA